MNSQPTLAARLTPVGPAALATLGILGPDARTIVEELFQSPARRPMPADRPLYGQFGAGVVDDVVLHLEETPAGTLALVHSHGGVAMVEALTSAVSDRGAKKVDWREFERARGCSEVQIEAQAVLARAPTARTAAILLDQLQGALDEAFRLAATDPLVALEALRWERVGRRLVEPWRIALYGPANVGKSSLLNVLVGYNRAIVAPVPGTTRDVVRATTAIDGWPVEWIDGAGFRSDPEVREAEGAERLRVALEECDLRILVVDLSQSSDPSEEELRTRIPPDLIVGNKCDLPIVRALDDEVLRCSAATGEGIPQLVETVATRIVPVAPPPNAAVPFTQRQVNELRRLADVR